MKALSLNIKITDNYIRSAVRPLYSSDINFLKREKILEAQYVIDPVLDPITKCSELETSRKKNTAKN